MVNSKPQSTTYTSPKAKKEKRYPPTTPPTVSVGAIKRSLEHTPSPRRFKKLRQRKLQERFLVSLTESNLAALGRDKRVNRREYGGSGVGVEQGDGHESLEELDLAVLNIGLDGGHEQAGELLGRNQPLPCSLSSAQEPSKRFSPEPCRDLYGADADGEGPEEVVKKRQPRSGNKSRKRLRRLLVDELLLVSERVGDLSLQGYNDEGEDLSQDPISQSYSDNVSPGCRKLTARQPAISRIHRGFGDIDISKFRLPNPIKLSPRSQHRHQRSAAYSDGFEGEEAFPARQSALSPQMGRFNRRVRIGKVPFGELTLVADRNSGRKAQVIHASLSRSRRPYKIVGMRTVSEGDENGVSSPGAILFDPLRVGESTRYIIGPAKEVCHSSDDESENSNIVTTKTLSSPLARKISRKQHTLDGLQKLKPDLEALQQLSIVSVCKGLLSSGSDNNHSDIDSGDEADIEMDDDI